MGIGDPGNCRDALPEFLGDLQVLRAVVADGADVDLRRQAEIEDLRDDVGRLEIEGRVGEGGGKHLAQLADIVCRRRVAVLQLHLDHAVIGPDGRAVGKGEIIGPRRKPDIVDDEAALVFGNDLPDLVLDRLEDPLGGFDAGAGRCADMELDQPAVDEREEVASDEHEHCRPERQRGHGDGPER